MRQVLAAKTDDFITNHLLAPRLSKQHGRAVPRKFIRNAAHSRGRAPESVPSQKGPEVDLNWSTGRNWPDEPEAKLSAELDPLQAWVA